jgi:hypothetical protein
MRQRLTDTIVKVLPAPQSGNRITYDAELPGFGCRVTAAGTRAFVLYYLTTGGRERRITIGQHPAWSLRAARDEAERLRREIDSPDGRGRGRLRGANSGRAMSAVSRGALAEEARTLGTPRRALIDREVLPRLRRQKVADVSFSDVDRLHREVTKRAPIRANRAVALCSKMFSLAIRWGWGPDNPAKGIERNPRTSVTAI